MRRLGMRFHESDELTITYVSVAEAEGRGHEVEMLAGERKIQRVGFDPTRGRILRRSVGRRRALSRSPLQHRMREIGAHNLGRGLPCLTAQRERHVASPAAQVEDSRILPRQDVAKGPSGATPPHAINVERQHMVQQIVARRDGGEHLAHRASRRSRVTRAFGGGADNGGFGEIRHDESTIAD